MYRKSGKSEPTGPLGPCLRLVFCALMISGVVFASPLVDALQGQPRGREARLLRAARAGDLSSVAELLNDGTAVDARGEQDLATPLMLAIDARQVEMCRLLLAHGADPDVTALRGDSPLTRALRRTASDKREPIVRLLLDAGADPELHGDLDVPPLNVASMYGRTRAVELLLEAGADVNRRGGRCDATPLLYAASGGAPSELVSLLIRAGADLNATDSEGRTALSEAAACGRVDLVEILLRSGADPTLRDHAGSTPAARAAELGHPEIAAMLLQHR